MSATLLIEPGTVVAASGASRPVAMVRCGDCDAVVHVDLPGPALESLTRRLAGVHECVKGWVDAPLPVFVP